jgi:hypothetical protein
LPSVVRVDALFTGNLLGLHGCFNTSAVQQTTGCIAASTSYGCRNAWDSKLHRRRSFSPLLQEHGMRETTYIRWFSNLSSDDVPLVGGKNASLGEMYRHLTSEGVQIPNGFAITSDAYRYVLDHNKAWQPLHAANRLSASGQR